MNIKEIKEMLQLMSEHDLSEFEVDKDGFKIKLKKNTAGKISYETVPVMAAPSPIAIPQAATPAASQPAASAPAQDANATVIKSPMVGTFYASPAPDQPAFVAPGKKIKEGDVLCIVEAMKLMNEIKAEISGEIIEVLVKNGQAIEFDQPLFKVKK